MKDENDLIEVGDAIYKLANPDTNMDTPSSVYEKLEVDQKKWIESMRCLEETFYEYCKRKLGIC
jgi:hypothetical protein